MFLSHYSLPQSSQMKGPDGMLSRNHREREGEHRPSNPPRLQRFDICSPRFLCVSVTLVRRASLAAGQTLVYLNFGSSPHPRSGQIPRCSSRLDVALSTYLGMHWPFTSTG